MIARLAPLALLCCLGVPASGRTVSTGGTEKVAKPEQQLGPVHWALWIDEEQVQIYPSPDSISVGARYDIIDERGLVGRAVVEHVEQQDSGCNTMTDIGTARWIGRPRRQFEGQPTAVGSSTLTTNRARVIQAHEARSLPPLALDDAEPIMVVDLDGDREPDLARISYYNCDVKGDKVVRQRYRNDQQCLQTWGRVQKKWKVLDTKVLDPCY